LVDSGAHAFALINVDLAVKLAKRFNIPTEPLNGDYRVTGFDGKNTTQLSHAIMLDIIVDGRHQGKVPFLIVPIGQHDMILGALWCAQNNVLIDCRHRMLVWPQPLSLEDEVKSKLGLTIPRDALDRPQIN
jgi:hypothetical protein